MTIMASTNEYKTFTPFYLAFKATKLGNRWFYFTSFFFFCICTLRGDYGYSNKHNCCDGDSFHNVLFWFTKWAKSYIFILKYEMKIIINLTMPMKIKKVFRSIIITFVFQI